MIKTEKVSFMVKVVQLALELQVLPVVMLASSIQLHLDSIYLKELHKKKTLVSLLVKHSHQDLLNSLVMAKEILKKLTHLPFHSLLMYKIQWEVYWEIQQLVSWELTTKSKDQAVQQALNQEVTLVKMSLEVLHLLMKPSVKTDQ